MSTCFVSLDLLHPSDAYPCLNNRLRELKFQPLLGTLWAATGDFTAEGVLSALDPCLSQKDRIAVIALKSAPEEYVSRNPVHLLE